ncbi:MAG: tetratricopeptide repeat protein [bacterium]|nr:tetratricopeptide repeat protein [bacterium]
MNRYASLLGHRVGLLCVALALLTVASPAMVEPAWAQNAGQAKLDEATDRKIDAQTPADLEKVIELCEEALQAGLDEGNSQIAKQLLASTALQRAQMLVQRLPQMANNANAVNRLKRMTMADLEKAIENNPELADAYMLIARLETLPGGSRENALENLDKAVELLKDRPVDQSKAYILRAAMQENNEAKLADLEKAIEADSTNAEAWQIRIALQMAMGKLQEAVEDAEQLLERDESNMFALQAAIQSLLQLNKTDEAISMLSKRIEKDPKNGVFYRVRAQAYMLAGDEDLAMEDLNKAIEINSRDFESLVMRGQLFYDQGEIEKANRDITDSLLIEPDSVQGVLMRSLVAAREERYGDAIADMEMLVRADPSNSAWVMQLASYYQMDNRPRRAISLLDELVRRDSDEWRAMRLRGDAKLAIGEHVSAIEDYEEAIRVLEKSREVSEDTASTDIDYSGLLNNLAWVLATSPNDELRDGEKSVELGLKACEATNYEAAHILSTLAAGYAEVGDFENARKWSSKAVELGEAEGNEQLEQLKEELEQYKQDKPWREEQQTKENEKPLSAASETIDT